MADTPQNEKPCENAFEREARAVARQLPPGHWVAVIGSTAFRHRDSKRTCAEIGHRLAQLKQVVLLTGGVPGVGETVGRAFDLARRRAWGSCAVYHILPHNSSVWDYGYTLFAGADMEERRETLGRLAPLYIAVEGGPGTAHEAAVAQSRSAILIPVGRSGGCSTELYAKAARPPFASDAVWRILGDSGATPEVVADAVAEIVRAAPNQKREA